MGRERSDLRNLGEFALCRPILAAMEILPARAIEPASRFLGALLDAGLAGRRRVVSDNVGLAYEGDPSRPEPRKLSRASFANLCRNFIELAQLPRTREELLSRVEIRTPDTYQEFRRIHADGPVIFSACHFGAYEIGGIVASCLGVDLLTLVRPLDNPWLEAWLRGIRMRFGQRLASNRGGARSLYRELAAGTSVAVLVDLNKRGRGTFVDFFGKPAATATTAAQLACRMKRPLVPTFTWRARRPMHFEIELGHPIWPVAGARREDEIQRLLQEATREIEQRVRKEPEQWLWTHRRWKTRPAGERVATANGLLGPSLGEDER